MPPGGFVLPFQYILEGGTYTAASIHNRLGEPKPTLRFQINLPSVYQIMPTIHMVRQREDKRAPKHNLGAWSTCSQFLETHCAIN